MSSHVRPTVAKWLHDLVSSARLSLLVALIVIGVVASVTYLEMRSFERAHRRRPGGCRAVGSAISRRHLAARAQPLDPLDIRDTLHDLVEADPVLDAISVFETDETGHLRVLTSTSTEERAEVLDLAGRALATKAPASDRSDRCDGRHAGAAPRDLCRGGDGRPGESAPGAHARTACRARVRASRPSLLVTVLVHLTVRRLVGRPLGAILRTDGRDGGRRSARTDDRHASRRARHDRAGLNEMLDQLERFNLSLQRPHRGGDARSVAPQCAARRQPEPVVRGARVAGAGRAGGGAWARSPPTSRTRLARR